MTQHQIRLPDARRVHRRGIGGVNGAEPRAQSGAEMRRPIGECVRGQEMLEHPRFQFAVVEPRCVD
jgi:hypothetical protein